MRNSYRALAWGVVFFVVVGVTVIWVGSVPSESCAFHEGSRRGGGLGSGGGCATQMVTGPNGPQLCTTCCNIYNPNDCTTFCNPVMGTSKK